MYYERKLFALLHDPYLKALYRNKGLKGAWQQVSCLNQHAQHLKNWWDNHSGVTADHIASASDRLSFQSYLRDTWCNLGEKVREAIKDEVCRRYEDSQWVDHIQDWIGTQFPAAEQGALKKEFLSWQQGGRWCWTIPQRFLILKRILWQTW
ncbi:MAG: hypothetical protein ACK4K5_05700 [Thermosynechococcus sp.]|uniref:hypothetical protein n=1 Tax=Thermosynechococcus sp. TaxID=2814275 RepID=UPI00391BD0B1